MSSTAPIRKKRYHKRSSWACDECKLRKKKCDGEQPCAMCALIGTPCAYLSRTRPHKTPTQRVRELEEQARSFRELLARVRNEVSDSNAIEVERMLSVFEGNTSDGSQSATSPAVTVANPNVPLTTILDGHGRFMRSGPKSMFFGPSSFAALICAMLDFFDGTDSTQVHALILNVFEKDNTSLLESDSAVMPQNTIIPAREEMISFLQVIHQQIHPAFQVIDTADFITLLDITSTDESHGTSSSAFAFVHATAALGYSLSTDYHAKNGCGWNLARSAQHYRISLGTLSSLGSNDVLSLRVCLFLLFYNCCVCQLSEAYAVLGVAQSIIVRQGLLQASGRGEPIGPGRVGNDLTQIITTLEIIDCFLCTTLGLPRVMPIRPAEPFDSISSEMSGHDLRLRAVHGLVSSTALVMSNLSSSVSSIAKETIPNRSVDQSLIDQANQNFGAYTQILEQYALTNTQDAIARTPKQGLLTTFWWAELTVYSPFLHYLQPLAEGQSPPPSLSEPALRCLKLATNTINSCEAMLRSRNDLAYYAQCMHPGNSGTLHALFLSTLSLVFLICVHKGTKPPGEAWRKAETGIRLLEALRCEAGGAGQCLGVIKEMVRQLNHFVHFDFDHIERTTQRICYGDHERRRSLTAFNCAENLAIRSASANLHTSLSRSGVSADEMLAYASHLHSDDRIYES